MIQDVGKFFSYIKNRSRNRYTLNKPNEGEGYEYIRGSKIEKCAGLLQPAMSQGRFGPVGEAELP